MHVDRDPRALVLLTVDPAGAPIGARSAGIQEWRANRTGDLAARFAHRY